MRFISHIITLALCTLAWSIVPAPAHAMSCAEAKGLSAAMKAYYIARYRVTPQQIKAGREKCRRDPSASLP